MKIVITGGTGFIGRMPAGRRLGPIEFRLDPEIQRIVAGWPSGTAWVKAASLGRVRGPDLDTIIGAYIEEFLLG